MTTNHLTERRLFQWEGCSTSCLYPPLPSHIAALHPGTEFLNIMKIFHNIFLVIHRISYDRTAATFPVPRLLGRDHFDIECSQYEY